MGAFDARKFEELILYIAERTRDDPDFGRTKLAKVLFYSDFESHRVLGAPITGARYVNWEHGPFPPSLKSSTQLLKNARRIEVGEPQEEFDTTRVIPTGHRESDLAAVGITPEEATIVDEWIERIRTATAREIKRLSHDHPGYKMVARNDEIPYESTFLAQRAPNDAELEAAKRIARGRGLLVGDDWQR